MVDVADKYGVDAVSVDEWAVIEKVNRLLHTLRYDGVRLLLMLYFLNQRVKWVDSYTAAELGMFSTDFYTASTRLEKLGLVERRRLNIKSYLNHR